jgi:hypothetical protein
MLRYVLGVVVFLLAAGCTSDRCRVYGTWAADGSLSASPFLYPTGASLRRDKSTPTGVEARLPKGYRSAVIFAEEYERLDGLGLTSPLLISDDFVELFFHSGRGLRIGLYDAEHQQHVALDALEDPPRGLRGAMPQSPLLPNTQYYMTVSGKASTLPCNDGPVVVLTETDAEAREVERQVAKPDDGTRMVVVPFRTQSVFHVLETAAAVADGSDHVRVLSAAGDAPFDADGNVNDRLFNDFPVLTRGIQYGEKPRMPLDNIATIVTGKVRTLEFRKNGRLDSRTVESNGTRDLEYILTLPKSGAGNLLPRPGAAGRPQLVLFSHPLRACKEAALGLADMLAQHGFAVASIDHVEHGSRQSDRPDDYVCGESIPWSFFAGGNPAALRDNVRASALDLYQFKVALQKAGADVFDLDGDGEKDFESENIALVAMSLGSIIATPFLAISPDVDVAVLNTALGTTIELVDQQAEGTSKYALPFPGPVPSLNLAVTQTILDAGEPINFASRLRAQSRDLLVQQVVDDSVVPNASTAKLARELGLTIVRPVHRPIEGAPEADAPYTGAPTRALYQVDDVNHSFLLIPRNLHVLEPARRQVAYFLYSHYVQGQGTVLPIEY